MLFPFSRTGVNLLKGYDAADSPRHTKGDNMANCPKCGVKLKLTDIDQCCPKCGVNMRLYGFEENFYREAKTAELSQAGYSCKIRRFKMSMVGSKLTVARLVVMLLPLAALLIPAGKAVITMPLKEAVIPLSGLGLYTAFSGGEFNLIMSLASGGTEAAVFSALRLAMFLIAACAVVALFVFIFSLFCFASIKNMQKVICVTSALGIVCSLAAVVSIFVFAGKTDGSVMLSGSSGFGLYAAVLMFAAVFIINLLIEKKGIKVEYDEGMVERSEIWKKVKAGELKIDDLPYPVVETAETRKIRDEILAEREAFRKTQNSEKEETADEREER